jgi:hypothetical protein
MNPNEFLLLNLALAFYAVGAIWAHEIDIFRSWTLLDPGTFRRLQRVHWRTPTDRAREDGLHYRRRQRFRAERRHSSRQQAAAPETLHD